MGPNEEQKDCQNGLKIGLEQVKFVNILYVNFSFSRSQFLPFQLN